MIRVISSALLVALLAASPALAQLPRGWQMRLDRSTSAADPDRPGATQMMAMGGGFHVIAPQAGVFWNPANAATGNYTLRGRFTQLKRSSHPNFYGLVFGGSGIEGASQRYVYFLVAQDGSFLVKQRNGDNVTDVVGRTRNAAVRQPDAQGRAANDLEVRVTADKLDFVVNGTSVHSMPKGSLVTDGVYGLRVNHDLEVQVDNLAKQ